MSIAGQIAHIEDALNDSQVKMVCINDSAHTVDFAQRAAQIVAVYEKKLPDKSSFEK